MVVYSYAKTSRLEVRQVTWISHSVCLLITGYKVYAIDLDREAQHVYAACVDAVDNSKIIRIDYDGSNSIDLVVDTSNPKAIAVDASDGTG